MKNKSLGWLIISGWIAALVVGIMSSALPIELANSSYAVIGLWLAVFGIWTAIRLIRMDTDKKEEILK